MNYLLTILLISFSIIDPTKIAKINAIKKEAEQAYLAGNFERSAEKYSYLLDTLNLDDEVATLNLAHSYFQLKNNDAAINNYQKLQYSKDESLKSLAYQQLGILSNNPNTLEKSLAYFKESIKSDPTNEDAKYNYELLKKKLKEQQQNKGEDQEDKNENQEKENKNGEKNEQKENKEGKQNEESEKSEGQKQNKGDEESQEGKQQKGEQQEQNEDEDTKEQLSSTSEKLIKINISEEKAKIILEALKNNEIQYIQQNRRKATKKKDKNKPDW